MPASPEDRRQRRQQTMGEAIEQMSTSVGEIVATHRAVIRACEILMEGLEEAECLCREGGAALTACSRCVHLADARALLLEQAP